MSPFPARTKEVLEKVASEKITKARASRMLGVSRKTIYEWLEGYEVPTPVKRLPHDRKQLDRNVLRIALTSPGIGPKKISQELTKIGQPWSVRSVWLSLKRQNLSTTTLRRSHAEQYRVPREAKEERKLKQLRLIPLARKQMVESVLLGDEKVIDITRKYHLSRKTFAKWKNRYLAAQEHNETILDALDDGHPTGSAHPKGASAQLTHAVLTMVVANPHLSTHKIAQHLGTISNHGVQRILERAKLSHIDDRLRYAQEHAGESIVPPQLQATSFWDRVRLVWEKFIVGLAPAPPPASLPASGQAGQAPQKKTRFIRTILFSAIASSFLSFIVFSWLGLVSKYPQPQAIGLLFASTALLAGTIFFLYSLKYYITLAIVLSFSQKRVSGGGMVEEGWRGKGLLEWILGIVSAKGKIKSRVAGPVGLEPNLSHIHLEHHPMVSIHIPLYNEKNVAERAVAAACNLDYPSYEVIIADDSTDTTPDIIRHYQEKFGVVHKTNGDGWTMNWVQVRPGVILKHLHRTTREGFKGAALKLALEHTYPMVEFVSVFDADFVPYPDTLTLFLKYFKVQNDLSEDYSKSNVAVVQGYQWHVLNKSENWLTRGVRSEYAGSYVVERAGEELYGGLKQISGSVYMIRRAPLEEVGWRTSITEDFELTLRLYEKGYKVVYTPYIQAPAECVSTLKRLIHQRMRWAEGHSFNVKHMLPKLMSSDKLTLAEKFEMMYLSPYYLQALFFMIGTIAWLTAETAFRARLPFWTSLWGWSLVLTNMLSLPLVNLVGLFLEESEQKDYVGIASFVALSYLLVPFQAYAAVKGFLEKEEGPWFRTPKTGRITDVFTRGRFYRLIAGIFTGDRAPAFAVPAFAPSMSPYLALATANNQFNRFILRPKRSRWLGKTILTFLLIFSIIFYSFGLHVPVVYANPDTFYLWDGASANVNTTPNISWQLQTSADTTNSTVTTIKPGKNVTGTFQWKPGVGNNATAGTPGTPTNMGWIRDQDMAFNSIAAGTWSFTICKTDANSTAVGYLRVLVWAVALTGTAPSMTVSGQTLIYDSGTAFSATDLWTNTATQNFTLTSASQPIYTFDGTNKYLYAEFWNVITTGPSAAAATITFIAGNGCTTNPQITTPVVTIPERVILFLPMVPLIPRIIAWIRKRKILCRA